MKTRKITALLLSAVIMCSACADNNAEITTTVTENVITEEAALAEASDTSPAYEIVDGTLKFPEGTIEISSGMYDSDEKIEKIIVPDGVEIIDEMAFWFCNNVTEIYLPDSIRIIRDSAFPTGEKLNIIYKGKIYPYKDKELFYNTFSEDDYIAPPDGMTTDDLCGMLYYNGRQLQLPLTVDDFLALNENWIFDGADSDGYFLGYICEVDEDGKTDWSTAMLISVLNGENPDPDSDTNREFLMGGFDLGGFSLNGDIEIGDDYSELKAVFGEPNMAAPNSEEERDINGYDYYWFRDEKRIFMLGVDYKDGKIDDITISVQGVLTEETGFTEETVKKSAYAEAMEYEVVDGTVIIPDGTTEIKSYAFSYRWDITGVSIPTSVVKIGRYAFEHCENLKEVVIPDTVTEISTEAFTYCEKLERIVIPESITEIPAGMLYKCEGLTQIVVPEGVEFIRQFAFTGCENVTEVHIPDSIRIIEEPVFPDGEKLNIIYKGKTYSYKDKESFYATFRDVNYTAPPDGMTTDDLCGILYYNGKQLQLPLTADDFLTLNDEWKLDEDVDDSAHIYFYHDNKYKGFAIYTHKEGNARLYEDMNRYFHFSRFDIGGFSLNGDIEIGDDYSEFKAFFGEPSGEYPDSKEEKDINGYDEYLFRDEKRDFLIGVTYADGKISDISISIWGLVEK